MVRARRRSRARQPTLLFRLLLAGGFVVISSSHVPYPEGTATLPGTGARSHVASVIDPVHTGAIAKAIRKQLINRGTKSNFLVTIRKPAAPAINAGYLPDDGLFAAPDTDLPRTAFLELPDVSPVILASAPAGMIAAVARPVMMPRSRPAVAVIAKGEPATAPMLTAYAATDDVGAKTAPFDAVLKDRIAPSSFVVVPNVDPNHAWVNTPLPASVHQESEIKCLATAIYFEARGEPERGQLAVAQVVLNRVKNPAYPNTICGVVYQNKNMRRRCQFSFACDGRLDRITDATSWKEADDLAHQVIANASTMFLADVGTSTHYHATYVRPRWARHMKKMDKIGRHIFYKTYGGGWS